MQVSEGLAFFQPEPTLQGRSACCVWQGRYPPTFCMCWGFPGLQNTPPHGPEPTLRVWIVFFPSLFSREWTHVAGCNSGRRPLSVYLCVLGKADGACVVLCPHPQVWCCPSLWEQRRVGTGGVRGHEPRCPPSFPSSSPQSLGILNLSPGFMKIYLLPRRLEHVLYHSLLVWLITFTCLDKGYVGLAFLPWAL